MDSLLRFVSVVNIQRQRFPKALLIAVIISIILFLFRTVEMFWIKQTSTVILVSNFVAITYNLIASAALFTAAIRTWQSSKRMGIVWGFFFTAQLLYTVGDSIWAFLETQSGAVPFPSPADWFYIAYYPLMLVGLSLLPDKSSSWAERSKKIIDLWIIFIASLLFFYNFFIGPLFDPQTEFTLVDILSLAYPIGGLVLLWGILRLTFMSQDKPLGIPLLFLGMSCTLMVICDILFSVESLSKTYFSGHFLGLGWAGSYLLAALAGFSQAFSLSGTILHPLTPHQREPLRRILAISPYFWVIAAYTLLIVSHYQNLPMNFSMITAGVGATISLVIIRQLIALVENQHLNNKLNLALAKVQSQAADLRLINDDLSVQVIQREEVEEKLAYLALHDNLTGLPNRSLFLERLEGAIEYARHHPGWNASILFLDLDHFKVINDSLGHTIGDNLLIEVARRLTACLKPDDTICRLGGDEFVVLLEDTRGDETAVEVAQCIQQTLGSPFYPNNHEVVSTTSIGVVTRLDGSKGSEEALRNADIAMYKAKKMGKAQYVIFTDELLSQAVTRMQMENELRHALEKNEFLVFYQPICSLKNESLIGFEALVRWNHPQKGILTPCEFIPIAEESDLILEINEWVLKEACSQMFKWNGRVENKELFININIASKQFAQPNFVNRVERILSETGLNPACLILEITERVVIENLVHANYIFTHLESLGVKFQVDDFGTGYSSLSYLQHFPIQGIKIDMSFIQELDKPGKNSNLVHTILSMAKDLGMAAIAEGVETQNQIDILKELSCEYAQGYYLGKPMNAKITEELILNQKKCPK